MKFPGIGFGGGGREFPGSPSSERREAGAGRMAPAQPRPIRASAIRAPVSAKVVGKAAAKIGFIS
jgi:hypothetical protein